MPKTNPTLKERQEQLAQGLLQPDGFTSLAHLDLPDDKLKIYNGLMTSTLESCISGIYPLTSKLLKSVSINGFKFKTLAEEYRRKHPNQSYRLLPAVENFPAFLTTQENLTNQFPFLPEMAAYEWEESLLENAEDPLSDETIKAEVPTQGNWDSLQPVWNPVSTILELNFDIPNVMNTIMESETIEEINPESKKTWVLIFRAPTSFKVRFFILNPLTMALLERSSLQQSYKATIEALIEESPALKDMNRQSVLEQCFQLLNNCHQQHILLGSSPI